MGRVPGSPLTGDEVVPALPEVFRSSGFARRPAGGSTGRRDRRGHDRSARQCGGDQLLQGIGYGVEQKVLDVLQRWHFRPAMRDGVTIASQHIVHFHYPS